MPRTLIIFLIFFSFFLACSVYITVLLQGNNNSFQTTFYQNPTPTVTALYSLTLSPENITVLKGQTNTINILLESQNNTVTQPKLIQVEIAYDPKALSDVVITPGDFFTNPTIPLEKINTHSGRISYVLEATNQKTTTILKKHVARLTFVPNPAFLGQETSITFMGKTMLRGTTDTDIHMATYGTKLFFASSSAALGL